jgi:biotin transport system ATP-binding protein
MVTLDAITLHREAKPVFQDLSLTLGSHRTGLIGDNGSGKTSLLRLIKGLMEPSSGSISAPTQIGFVFQNPDHQLLFPTVMEELCFGLKEQGVSELDAIARAKALLMRYEMTSLQDQPTHVLSDGQKQLLCILSVLVDGASLLLLDEPCASLDRRTTKRVMGFIADLPQPVIMASHDLALVEDFDELIWLEQGRVQMRGVPASVIPAYLLHTAKN